MEPISNSDLERLRDTLAKHEVEYLLIGKMAAIVQGFPDTTQDADLFVERSAVNGTRLVEALRDLGFELAPEQVKQIQQGKDFIQVRTGPFDVDIVHAPDGIERYEDARQRGQQKDRETLPRLRDFATYLKENPPPGRLQLPARRYRASDPQVAAAPERPSRSGNDKAGDLHPGDAIPCRAGFPRLASSRPHAEHPQRTRPLSREASPALTAGARRRRPRLRRVRRSGLPAGGRRVAGAQAPTRPGHDLDHQGIVPARPERNRRLRVAVGVGGDEPLGVRMTR